MKLTDAVTKGREMLDPRQGNDLYAPEEGCEKYGGCYRGMAVVGAGEVQLPIMDEEQDEEGFDLTDVLTRAWPWVHRQVTYPCACTMVTAENKVAEMAVAHMMAHLWDKHVQQPFGADVADHIEALDDPWTFERITDWLRSIEPQDEPRKLSVSPLDVPR